MSENEENVKLTCSTCRFLEILPNHANAYCMVMQPHYVPNGDSVKLVDGVRVEPERMACSHHPQARGSSTSDQFIKLLQTQLAMAGVEMQNAAQMRSYFLGEEEK